MNKKNMFRIIKIAIFLSVISCSDNPKVVQELSDDFSEYTPFWSRLQVSDSTRYDLVKDPLDENNSTLLIQLHSDDFNSGGKRSEFTIKTKDTVGFRVEYSFKFMLTEQFFEKNKEKDWIIIQQWHDDPPINVSWKDYDRKTRPPISVYLDINPNKKYTLNYAYGLRDKDINRTQHAKFLTPLKPNTWYTFSNVIKWSLDKNNGYSIPKLNDQFLVEFALHNEHKLIGNNMFNPVPNYYKMGLYGNYDNNDTISILFDDFSYKLYER